MTEPTYLDIPGVCAYSTLKRRTVEALVASGALPSSKIGRRRVIARKDIDAYIARHRQVGTKVGAA